MRGARATRLAAMVASAAAMLPFAALNLASAGHAATSAPDGFDPPRARLILVRTLHSPLADGREVVSRRTYEVTITPDGSGWRVDGRQVAASVDAPPALRMLAELERNRGDSAQFPIRLDSRGMILPARGAAGLPPTPDLVRPAAAYPFASRAEPGLQAMAQGIIERFQQKQVITAWPADLFRPAPGQRSDTSSVALPDGSMGRVTVIGDSRIGGAAGLLSTTERVVTTELGSSRRTLREEWTLRLAE